MGCAPPLLLWFLTELLGTVGGGDDDAEVELATLRLPAELRLKLRLLDLEGASSLLPPDGVAGTSREDVLLGPSLLSLDVLVEDASGEPGVGEAGDDSTGGVVCAA